MQYKALGEAAKPYTWYVKPKFDLMAELALTGDDSGMNWVCRDEEAGRTTARLGRSRGSVQSPWSLSSRILQKLCGEFAVPVH